MQRVAPCKKTLSFAVAVETCLFSPGPLLQRVHRQPAQQLRIKIGRLLGITSRFSEMSFICSSVTGLIRNAYVGLPALYALRILRLAVVANLLALAMFSHPIPSSFSITTLCSCVTSRCRGRGERPASDERSRQSSVSAADCLRVSPQQTPHPSSRSASPAAAAALQRARQLRHIEVLLRLLFEPAQTKSLDPRDDAMRRQNRNARGIHVHGRYHHRLLRKRRLRKPSGLIVGAAFAYAAWAARWCM